MFLAWSRADLVTISDSPSLGRHWQLDFFTSACHPHCHNPDKGRKKIDKCKLLLLTLSWIQVPRPLSPN